MNPVLARAITAKQKLENGQPLDPAESDVASLALRRLLKEARVPFQRYRDHFVIGCERHNTLDGLDYIRTILMSRKSDVWYPDSPMSQVSVFSVYAASQVEPPDPNVFDENRGQINEYVEEYADRSHIGPSSGASNQYFLEESPIIDGIRTVKQSLLDYAEELASRNSVCALEAAEELIAFLTGKKKDLDASSISELMQAYVNKHTFRGNHRSIRGPAQQVADRIRQGCNYACKVMIGSDDPMTREIGEHLEAHIKVRKGICEYTGDWKWLF